MSVAAAFDTRLVGRDDEITVLEGYLDNVGVAGAAVVLVGDPGIGKSALQAQLIWLARSRGFTVLRARGSEAETYLPFACLHQLVRPLLPHLEQLSAKQRAALLAAFGMSDDEGPEPFLIALAVLELIVDAARRGPVLVSLDDMHWMDQPSIDTIGFLARRLAGEQVVLVASTRPGVVSLVEDPSVVSLSIGGLSAVDAGALLDRTAPRLPSPVRDRILCESKGNPLALLEFPRAVTGGQSTPGDADGLPMTLRLERAFAARARALAPDTATALVVTACNDGGDLAEILAATGVLVGRRVDVDLLQPAIEAGLVQADGRTLRFRHPLVRSAIRQSAPLVTRLAVHAALAQVLAVEPDRAAWHRSEAAIGPDEVTAAALQDAAVRSMRRGATQSAVSWLKRAAVLSPDDQRRGARLLSAAELAFELGQFAEVDRLTSTARALPLTPRDRSRLTWLEGVFDDGTPGEAAQVLRLVDLARKAAADDDADLAIQLLVGAARRVWWGDPGTAVRHDIVSVAGELGLPTDDPRLLACYAVAEPFEYGRYVTERLTHWGPEADGRPEMAGLLGLAAFCAGNFGPAVGFLSRPVEALRSQGRLGLLAQSLTVRAWSAIYIGSFEVARSADEAIRLADETSQPVWGATARIAAALLAGLRGDPTEALLTQAGRVAAGSRLPMSSLLSGIQLARGVSDLGAGRYESAYGHLRRMWDPREPCFHHVQRFWSLGYLAEAAAHSGRRREGRLLLADIERLIGDRPCPAAEIGVFFANTVLAEDDTAQSWYEAALIGPGSDLPWHRARVQLNYGSWLRRHRRTRDSRPHLRSARQTFEALGATVWAGRADLELRATGEKGWSPVVRGWDLLSPQESQIVHLAAQGLSNKEIAEQLFLSHRTVGSHLYRIFPKLGISSRAQLASAVQLASAGAAVSQPD